MCGRYGFSVDTAEEVYERFQIETVHYDLKARYNIAPGQINPVVISHSPNELTGMFWGLIPFFAKDETYRFKTINARVEGVESKPTYRKPFRFQRCLVPATGFYEWDKSSKPSQPFYFTMKDKSMFSFAGLYDMWKNPQTGKEIYSYTIITTQANGVVGKVHHRMPVILRKEDEEDWLNHDITEPERLHEMLGPYADDEMDLYPVSRSVNIPTVDSPDLIKPKT